MRTVPERVRRPGRGRAAQLALALFTASRCCLAAEAAASDASEETDSDVATTEVVVFIGTAADGGRLHEVLTELLERQGVHPEYVSQERFDPGALLSEGETDSRGWVFIVLRGEHEARLYFRGPHGRRFLLRELSLRSGLDEVGRESIAQVVETSTVALFRSTAGLSRDEATASLAREDTTRERRAAPSRAPPPSPRPSRAMPDVLLGARTAVVWNETNGGPAAALGAEGALGSHFSGAFVARARVAFEYRTSQTIATPDVSVHFGSAALRGGVDGGFSAGPHAAFLGLGAGVDFDRVSTSVARSHTLELVPARDDSVAMLRAELRYELTLGSVWVAASVFSDFSTVRTHYDVARASGVTRLGELWPARPGLSLTVGFSNASVSRARDTGVR